MKNFILTVGKTLLVIGLAYFLWTQAVSRRESGTPFETVTAAVLAAADTTNMQQADDQMIRRLYGLDPDSYDGILLYSPGGTMDADELLIVKLSDISQQDEVTAAVTARRDAQLSAFEGYGVDQTDMLEHSIIDVQGNYILFVSAPNPADAKAAFESVL